MVDVAVFIIITVINLYTQNLDYSSWIMVKNVYMFMAVTAMAMSMLKYVQCC